MVVDASTDSATQSYLWDGNGYINGCTYRRLKIDLKIHFLYVCILCALFWPECIGGLLFQNQNDCLQIINHHLHKGCTESSQPWWYSALCMREGLGLEEQLVHSDAPSSESSFCHIPLFPSSCQRRMVLQEKI